MSQERVNIQRDISEEVHALEKAAQHPILFSGDKEDMLHVARLMRLGQLREACHLACDLDTFVRDCIPEVTWDLLCEHR